MKTARFTVSLPDALLREVDRRLVGDEETRSSVIRRLLEGALREAEERRDAERYLRAYQEQPQTEEEFGWSDRVAPLGLHADPWA